MALDTGSNSTSVVNFDLSTGVDLVREFTQTVNETDNSIVRDMYAAAHIVEMTDPALDLLLAEVPSAVPIGKTDEFPGQALLAHFDFPDAAIADVFVTALERQCADIGHAPVFGPFAFSHKEGDDVGPTVIAVNFSTKHRDVDNRITTADFVSVARAELLYKSVMRKANERSIEIPNVQV